MCTRYPHTTRRRSILPSKDRTAVELFHFALGLGSFLREELEVTDDMGEDIDLADLVPKVYEPVISWDILQTKLISNMTRMNEEIRGSNMDLVFFKDAMVHLLRVSNLSEEFHHYKHSNI